MFLLIYLFIYLFVCLFVCFFVFFLTYSTESDERENCSIFMVAYFCHEIAR